METINKLRKFYQLKNVERVNSVGKRKESTAEHSWSCLILADYFLTEMNEDSLDRLKVYELLMYHDVVEIESGDVCISDEAGRVGKKEREMAAMHVLVDHIPQNLGQKFVSLFNEFEEQATREAKFAKAIDVLDAQIHEMDYKEDWKGWTEEFLRGKKQHLFEEFPIMMESFETIIKYLVKNDFFDESSSTTINISPTEKIIMETINKLRRLYELKNVERVGPVGERKESPAEHTWSALMLADYFLTEIKDHTLDRLKVYELLMYHDVVEIETGDVGIGDYDGRVGKQEREQAAAHVLKDHLPTAVGNKFYELFQEFEARETQEAKFANAVDSFDAVMHFLDYKSYWQGWDEQRVREGYHKISVVSIIQEEFEKVMEYVKENGYLDQS